MHMIRYHEPKLVTECPKCGRGMKQGRRVYMTFAWERGSRHNRWSTSGFLCRDCAGKLMGEMGLEKKE